MMLERDIIRIRHMLDSANEAVQFTCEKTRGDLDDDRKLALSLTKLVEIIGEAAANVSPETRQRYAAIPWKDIVGMRHHLVHGYDLIDLDILWQVVHDDLPDLIVELKKIFD